MGLRNGAKFKWALCWPGRQTPAGSSNYRIDGRQPSLSASGRRAGLDLGVTAVGCSCVADTVRTAASRGGLLGQATVLNAQGR